MFHYLKFLNWCVAKIIVITANISLLIFHLWCGNNKSEIFPQQFGKLSSMPGRAGPCDW